MAFDAPASPDRLADAEVGLIDIEAANRPPPRPTPVRTRTGRVLLAIGLVLVALNLRPIFSSLSALLPEIMHTLGVSPATASLMTTLPVLCLGLFAPAAPLFAQRLGTERTILVFLAVLALGTGLRGLASLPALLAGSALAGGAIAIINVLLPGLVKRDFPDHAALMTGVYTMAICSGSALAAGLTVPLERAFDSWPLGLAIWAVPAIVVALLWLPQTLAARPLAQSERAPVRGLWRDRLAWQVTLFMGLQSSLAYAIFGWLAPMLRERGLDGTTAGYIVSTTVVTQLFACLVLPSIATRCRDQRGIAIFTVLAAVVGYAGLVFAPLSTAWIFALIQGFGQGGTLAVAMTVIILRAPDSRVAAHLSGMAQGIGYTLASLGPFLTGLIRQWSGGFGGTVWLFGAMGAACAIAVLGAGRARHVQAR
jgi:CP family cyanate transporter-like MFS transporter